MFKVSVILATYNRAHTLRACIDSVIKQDFHDFYEFIIVDDGSTDDSEMVVRGYSLLEPRIRYFKIPNGGQANALNHGILQAKGDYVAFIDSDDEYHPHHISTLYNMSKETGSDFLLAGLDVVQHGAQSHVIDFYDKTRTIPVTQVECTTGLIFGRRDKIVAAGGFQKEADFPDTQLFDTMKKLNYKWAKSSVKTYRYHFGQCSDNVSAKLSEKYS